MLSFNLEGLSQGRIYVVKVKVWDEAGNMTEYATQEITSFANTDPIPN